MRTPLQQGDHCVSFVMLFEERLLAQAQSHFIKAIVVVVVPVFQLTRSV